MGELQWIKLREEHVDDRWEAWLDFPEVGSSVKLGKIEEVQVGKTERMYDLLVGPLDRQYRTYDTLDEARMALIEYLIDLVEEHV